ncbi:hypothetical protein [Streptomyces sp. DSM 118148]
MGIDRDRKAVIADVNRIKILKRQVFGRAGFRLGCKRILLTP